MPRHALDDERLRSTPQAGVLAEGLHEQAGVFACLALDVAIDSKVFLALRARPGASGAVRHVAPSVKQRVQHHTQQAIAHDHDQGQADRAETILKGSLQKTEKIVR
jgi:hypothetical protein